jgi:hypothetical protein
LFYDAIVNGTKYVPANEGTVQKEFDQYRKADQAVKDDITRSYLRNIDIEERINIV